MEFTQEFFDEASAAWKANKVRYGQASYRYKKNAFQPDPDLPPIPKQSVSNKQQTQKELQERSMIDEYAPPRVRKSPRLLSRRKI